MANPFKIRDIVRRVRAQDGTAIGPGLEIVAIGDHAPVDGGKERDAICYLSDGGWEFYWNLARKEK